MIKTKFWCYYIRKKIDIEDCWVCPYYDKCDQSEKHYAGKYMLQLLIRFTVLSIIIGGLLVWLM